MIFAGLLDAVKQYNYAETKRLLEAGADPNTAQQDGWTVLHEAASNRGMLRVLKLLIQNKANVDARYKNDQLYEQANIVAFRVHGTGWTPLHSAVTAHDHRMVEELIMAGADLSLTASKEDVQSGERLTPRELAEVNGFRHIRAFNHTRDACPVEELETERNAARKTKSASNLGRSAYTPRDPETSFDIDNVKVRVTRQDSTQHDDKPMMKEFLTFLKTAYPRFDQEFLKFPRAFQYDEKNLKDVEGPIFPADINSDREAQDRAKYIKGHYSEEKVYNSLHKVFQTRTSLMWHGFHVDKLFKIARDCAKYTAKEEKEKNGTRLDIPLTDPERQIHQLLGIDLEDLEDKLDTFLSEVFVSSDEISDADLQKALEEKCTKKERDPLVKDPPKDIRPAFQHLSGKDQSNYRVRVKEHVKKGLKKKKMKAVKREELENFLKRYFIGLLHNSDEYDNILLDKESSSYLHLEVKGYPLNDGPMTPEGLKGSLESANVQLGKGNNTFNKVLGPAAKLSSSWTKINLVCFPKIPNRKKFNETLAEPLDACLLKFVITEEELKNDKWLNDLQLGSTSSSKEDYENFSAIIVGSAHISYQFQKFDHQDEIRQNCARVAGNEKGLGIGGGSGHLPHTITFKDLKGKSLGHVWSIIFWTDEQMDLLASLKGDKSIILCGDYGGGKTCLLVSMARKAADEHFQVYFITTTSFEEAVATEYILDMAMKQKFEGSGVEVVTLTELRRTLNLPQASVSDLITEFMKTIENNENVKLFFDEFPVSTKDLVNVNKNEQSDLADLLNVIAKNCKQAYVALKTTCLLDTLFTPGQKSTEERDVHREDKISCEHLKLYLEEKTAFSVKELQLRMRNASNIGAAVVGNTEAYSSSKKKGINPTTKVLNTGKSNTTIPGEKPACILTEFGGYKPNMKNTTMCLNYALTQLLHLPTSEHPTAKDPMPPHIVVLCGDQISPKEVADSIDFLHIQPLLYDGGVESYGYATAHHYPQEQREPGQLNKQKVDLDQWLKSTGGILVTHNRLFAGMEAPTVILITKTLGTNETSVRSGMLRAVAKLIVITDVKDANKEEIEKHFEIHELGDC